MSTHDVMNEILPDVSCDQLHDHLVFFTTIWNFRMVPRSEKDHPLLCRLFLEELHKPLLSCFSDPTEAVRETSLNLVVFLCVEQEMNEEVGVFFSFRKISDHDPGGL